MNKHLLRVSTLVLGVASLTLAQADVPAQQAPRYQFAQQDQSTTLVPEQESVASEPASSQQRLGLIGRLDTLQSQMMDMRGQLEKQQHQLQQLQIAQREMYADLDKRLKKLETGSQSASAQTEQAAPAAGASQPDASEILNQQQAYQKAYDLIRARRYTEAQTSLQDYLQKYPDGAYAVNAHYWLGELGLLSGDSRTAAQEFSVVVTKYPKSQKVPDATLKLGFLAYDQGQWTVAKKYLNDVEQKYPNTSAAKLADQRLQQMKREGH